MQDQDHLYKTKSKTSIYVFEEPWDQDHGLKEYNAEFCTQLLREIIQNWKHIRNSIQSAELVDR